MTNPWELFSDHPDFLEAERAMNLAVEHAATLRPRAEAEAHMRAVQRIWSHVGADDSEPRNHAMDRLDAIFGREDTMSTRDMSWMTDYRPMRTPWRAFADWFLWATMRSHRYCRIDTDGMGCPREEHPGRIVRLWTATYDSAWDQKGYTYAIIRYEDGADDRHPYMTSAESGWPRSKCIFFSEDMQRYEYTR